MEEVGDEFRLFGDASCWGVLFLPPAASKPQRQKQAQHKRAGHRGHLGGGPRGEWSDEERQCPELNKEEKHRGKQRRKETEERNVLKVDRLSVGRDRPTFDLRIECCLLFLEDTLIASSLSSLQQVLRVWVWWCDQPPVLHSLYTIFSSDVADVALSNDICTRTQKIHKCRQIKTHQSTTRRTNKTTRNPQPDLRSSGKTANTDTQKGQEPKQQTTKRFAKGTQRTLPLCHTQKHAKINYSLRHAAKHRNWSTARSFVVIDENCTRAYKHRLSQRPLRCTCA